jgi:hypothetical protein
LLVSPITLSLKAIFWLRNEAEVTKSFTGLGGYDEFGINIMKFGGVYWIEAQEFDDIGYFSSEDDASSIAEGEYEPFISAASHPDPKRAPRGRAWFCVRRVK